MKKPISKRLLAALGVGVLLTGAAMALEAGDSLISLSYLTKTYIPAIVAQGSEVNEEKMGQAYEAASQTLEQVSKMEVDDKGMAYSANFQSRSYTRGDHVLLETGSGFLMLSGQAVVSHNGTFIDVTAGETVPTGSKLTAGHRYLTGEETDALIIFQSGLVRAGVEGAYAWEESGEQAAPFTDVQVEDWYCSAVDYVYFNQLFAGMGNDTFAPTSNMDRSMMMTVLYHLAGDPEQERLAATATFKDVPANQWYYTFVSWAAEQGVSAGTGNGMFSPGQPVTREQVIVLLYNFATNYMGMTLEERVDISGHADYDKVAFWSQDAVSWAVAGEVLRIPQGGALEPARSATRAEVASMLQNFSLRYLDGSN